MIRLFAAIAASFVLTSLPLHAAVEIKEVNTPGGINAWLVEEPSIPFVALEIRFRGGTALEAPEKSGAINLMTALIEEGSGDLDSTAFARARDDLAASFDFDVRDDALSVSAQFLTETQDEAIALLRTALSNPTFDEAALERVRAQVLANIRSSQTEARDIASRKLDEVAFAGHPYERDGNGTEETVSALTRDDIVAAHRMTLTRDRIYVGAVGDITPEKLAEVLDTLFADLPESGAPMPERIEANLEGGVHVVDFDTPQSTVLFAHRGLAREDEDFLPAYVLMEVFGGGGFGSRLMEEVREKRGLTYGIAAYLAPKDRAELILGSAATENARVAETIAVVREEWAKIAETGLTQEELDAAKTYLTGAYPLRFDGNSRIANILVGMQMDDLPLDYVVTRNETINAVTLEEINRTAARIFRPDELTFFVVGQPDGVEASN